MNDLTCHMGESDINNECLVRNWWFKWDNWEVSIPLKDVGVGEKSRSKCEGVKKSGCWLRNGWAQKWK